MHVGRCQQLLGGLDTAVLELDRLGTQHQMRKIKVPFVRRHVGTLGHVAKVAQVAVVDHAPVGRLLDAMNLAVVGGVDQIEQSRERLAQADATAAAMADVEHALEFLETRCFVVERVALPVQRMARGRLQIAFAVRHCSLMVESMNEQGAVFSPLPE
jgi:hypothetical protein